MKKRFISIVALVLYLMTLLSIHVSALDLSIDSFLPNGSSIPRKAIVIIPGLLGSTLYQGENRVWLGDTFNESFSTEMLALTETGASVYSISSINDYGVQDTYLKLYTNLYNTFNSYGYDILFFDYDWRLNNTYTASLLTSELANYDEVILVAHSMGGLVASKFLDSSSSNRNKTIAVFTLGTPFSGSAKSIQALETGHMITLVDIVPLYINLVKTVGRNSFAAYQLLPTSNYYSMTGHYPITYNGTNISNVYSFLPNRSWGRTSSGATKTMFSAAVTFHNSLGYGNSHITITGGVPVYTIAGSGFSTIATYNYDEEYNILDATEVNHGDDTVLAASAAFGAHTRVFPSVRHMDLPKDDDVIEYIIGRISYITDIVVSQTSTMAIDYNDLGVDLSDLVVNERGWLMGMDNRRITIITEGDNSVYHDDHATIVDGETLLSSTGQEVGHVWKLSDTRTQYSLYAGKYTLTVAGNVKIKFMNSGYNEGVYEYNVGNQNCLITINGYNVSPVCTIEGIEILPTVVCDSEID